MDRILVCPAELDQPTPPRPEPAADAQLTFNGPGGAYVAALSGWGGAAAKLLDDAKAACAR